MSTRQTTLTLENSEMTADLAARIGGLLRPGDVLLLSGQIGAGKTHFARSLIQSLQDRPEDVPSPTFTLVQEYETRAGALWHSDLYRLTGPDEIEELGLLDAMQEAICLIEWPDRLHDLAPRDALSLHFEPMEGPDHRSLTLSWTAPRWDSLATGLAA